MNKEQYIKRLLQKGYIQIDDKTFELQGMRFHLIDQEAQISADINSGPYLITIPDDLATCAACREAYGVPKEGTPWVDVVNRCAITGRFLGEYDDLKHEMCDQIAD